MLKKAAAVILSALTLAQALVFSAPAVDAAGVTTVNVINYGANGNDTLDDTIAIQRALNTALNSDVPVKVVVPKGVYFIGSPDSDTKRALRIYSNTTLELEEGAVMVRSRQAPSTYIISMAGYQNIAIKGGTFDGNPTNRMTARAIMSLRDIDGLTIEDVNFQNFCGTHAVIIDGATSLTVNRCTFSGFKPFADTPEEYTNQTSATSYWAAEALHIDFNFLSGRSMRDVVVKNCTFRNCPSGVGTHHVIEGYLGENIKIYQNSFENCYYCGCNATNFQGFEFFENFAKDTPSLVHIENVKGAVHDNFTDNSSYKPDQKTLQDIYGFGPKTADLAAMPAVSISNKVDKETGEIVMLNSSDVAVYNNALYVGSYTDPFLDRICAVKVTNYSKASVRSNIIVGAPYRGIYGDSSQMTVTGNTVTGCYDPVYFNGCESCSAGSNTVRSVGGSAITAVGCGQAVITDNTVCCNDGSSAAVEIDSCEDADVSNNTVSGSAEEGIKLSVSGASAISSNTIVGCASDALSISGSQVDEIKQNRISENEGLDLSVSDGSQIEDFSSNISDKAQTKTDETSTVGFMGESAVHNHSWRLSAEDPASCDKAGSSVIVCDDCGLKITGEISDPVMHSFNDNVVGASYLDGGKTTHSCDYCRKAFEDNYTQTMTLKDVSGMKALGTTANAVDLSWKKVPGASAYAVYVYNKSLKKWERFGNTTKTDLAVNQLNAGETYAFTVRAIGKAGSTTILSPNFEHFKTSTKPAKVSFTVTSTKEQTADLSWKKVTGATSYAVYYKPSATAAWQKIATVNNKTTTFTKTGLKEGATCYFTVKAFRNYEGTILGGAFDTKSVKIKAAAKKTAATKTTTTTKTTAK